MKSACKSVPVREDAWERLRGYKMGSATYDQVLNELMNALPLEDVAEKVVCEHRRRMKTRRGRSWKAVRKTLGDDRSWVRSRSSSSAGRRRSLPSSPPTCVDVSMRVFEALEAIHRPRPGCDIRVLEGHPNIRAVRVGVYRAIYEVVGTEVWLTKFERRSTVDSP